MSMNISRLHLIDAVPVAGAMPRTIICGSGGAKGLSVVQMAKLFTCSEGVLMEDSDGNRYLTPWQNVLIAHLATEAAQATVSEIDPEAILARKLAGAPKNKRLEAKEGNI